MPEYTTDDIRNLALVGHGGAGKTSLAEALLYKTGATRRLGSVNDRTSHLDYTEEEKEKGCSLDSALCYADHHGKRINIIDTPGSTDFSGPAIAALAAADTAVCVISAKDGIQVNTRKMMERAREYGLARFIVINKIDADNADFEKLVGQIQETFGQECVCVNLPTNGAKDVTDCWQGDTGHKDPGDGGLCGEARQLTVCELAAEVLFHQLVVCADHAFDECRMGIGNVGKINVAGIVGKANDELMEKYLGGELSDEEAKASVEILNT